MHYLFGLLFWCMLPFVGWVWLESVAFAWDQHDQYIPFLMGAAGYALLLGIRNKNFQHNLSWFQTFSHELTHVLFSLLTFNKIYGFNATSHSGGHISYSGKSNMLIVLSPYCIPIFTLFALLLRAIVNTNHVEWLAAVIGFTYCFHLQTFAKQTRHYQTDLKKYGLFPSYGFIILMNLFFGSVILFSVQYGLAAFKEVFIRVFDNLQDLQLQR